MARFVARFPDTDWLLFVVRLGFSWRNALRYVVWYACPVQLGCACLVLFGCKFWWFRSHLFWLTVWLSKLCFPGLVMGCLAQVAPWAGLASARYCAACGHSALLRRRRCAAVSHDEVHSNFEFVNRGHVRSRSICPSWASRYRARGFWHPQPALLCLHGGFRSRILKELNQTFTVASVTLDRNFHMCVLHIMFVQVPLGSLSCARRLSTGARCPLRCLCMLHRGGQVGHASRLAIPGVFSTWRAGACDVRTHDAVAVARAVCPASTWHPGAVRPWSLPRCQNSFLCARRAWPLLLGTPFSSDGGTGATSPCRCCRTSRACTDLPK